MKGLFTQGLAILLKSPISLTEVLEYLPAGANVRNGPPDDHWAFGGSAAVVSYRPDLNGVVLVDIVDQAWPDHMGDPKSEAMLFGAWSMGFFGPFAYPGGLARAMAHAWTWPEAREAVPSHRAFVRLRLSYSIGAGPETAVYPPDCDARHELEFLTSILQRLLQHPEAVCYFNPNGEVLQPADQLEQNILFHRDHDLPPLNVWSNVRLFNLGDGWTMMDTVGNHQLEIPDQECVFRSGRFEPSDVDSFLRNASLYLLKNGPVIDHGNTMNGPGDLNWQASLFENGASDPPREVICWSKQGERGLPSTVADRSLWKTVAKPEPKRPWWRRWRR